MRLNNQSHDQVQEAIRRIASTVVQEPLDKKLWIVEDSRIRVRE